MGLVYINQEEIHISKLKNFSKKIAKEISWPYVILLEGYLGSGKTTFCRSLINCFTKQKVLSPTFPILKEYKSSKGIIHHYDLYRIKSDEEFIELNLEESFLKALTLIEWPEKIPNFLYPKSFLRMNFSFKSYTERIIEYSFYY